MSFEKLKNNPNRNKSTIKYAGVVKKSNDHRIKDIDREHVDNQQEYWTVIENRVYQRELNLQSRQYA